jgi:hypothetical protein
VVFEKSRLSKQLRQLEESTRVLVSQFSQIALPVEPRIQECSALKFTKEVNSELTRISSMLESCESKTCFEEVEKALAIFSQRLAMLRGEVNYLRGVSELELRVLLRELFECRGALPQIPSLSSVLLHCYVEACLAKTEHEIEAAKAHHQRLRSSGGIHPQLHGIWERLLQREEELLSSVEEELARVKEIAPREPCEALKRLNSIARAANESKARCEEYGALRVELFSPRAVESFILPRAEDIFKSEDDVRRMLNERVFERLYSVVYRMLPAEEAEREVERLLNEYAKCIWYELKR